MSVKILINALDPEECRIAKVIDGKLEDFQIESASKEITQGNIYKGAIVRIEPSLQAVFMDYGAEKNGFLQKHEIHGDYFHDHPANRKSMKSLLKKGQEIMVQITKDPRQGKGAMLTTFISLAGRYIVLMPGHEVRGVSRKIEDEKERKRLKEIAHGLKLPEGFGIIVRTVGKGATKTVILKDLRYLVRLWGNIKKSVMAMPTPSLLHKERNLVVRSLRDYFTPDVDEILIDNPDLFKEAKAFIQIISPKHSKIVRLYKEERPLFSRHKLEAQIASIFENRVSLKSGGSIVIDQTEALVAIDVNSGKSTRKKNIEDTAHATNMEAAEEIARQLRLRDLGGLIVLDFIDMRDAKHKNEVVRTLKQHLKIDKAKSSVGNISKFGLLEMSRQRIRPAIDFGSHIICNHCRGKGVIPSAESRGLNILRRLNLKISGKTTQNVSIQAPSDVAHYLLNEKRKEIAEMESKRDIRIHIHGDDALSPDDGQIQLNP